MTKCLKHFPDYFCNAKALFYFLIFGLHKRLLSRGTVYDPLDKTLRNRNVLPRNRNVLPIDIVCPMGTMNPSTTQQQKGTTMSMTRATLAMVWLACWLALCIACTTSDGQTGLEEPPVVDTWCEGALPIYGDDC